MSPLAPSLRAQVDALHTVADWLAGLVAPPVGTVEVRPDGCVWIHVHHAEGHLAPPDVLRLLADSAPAADLTVGGTERLSGSRWGHRLCLRVPVPGVPVTLWCYETVRVPRVPGPARGRRA